MPTIRRIVAGVSGSPGSVHALRHAAGLARHHHAALIPLLAWLPPGGDLADRKSPDPELRQLWQDHAWQRLWETLDTRLRRPARQHRRPARRTARQARQSTDPGGPPGRRPAGHQRRTPAPSAEAGRLRRQPLLPSPRRLPGAGHPAPSPGPGSLLWPARLGVPPPLDPGSSTTCLGPDPPRKWPPRRQPSSPQQINLICIAAAPPELDPSAAHSGGDARLI